MNEEPCRIGSGGGTLLGTLHRPAGTPAGALLLCNPLFEERKSAQRILVELARTLSAAGIAVLRFDYRGCGDSEGEFASFSVPDWTVDIRCAADWLNGRYPGLKTGILGLRLGATLAMTARGGEPAFDFAVLWEPVVKGRDHLDHELRRKLMKEMMTFGKSQVTVDSLVKELEGGREIDFDGYPITPALYRDLCGLDLLQIRDKLPQKCLTVGIGNAERPSPSLTRLNDAFRAAGSDGEVRAVREQPFWSLVGLVPCPDLIRETAAWIKRAAGAE